MIIGDRVYGEIEITEPVILDLIQSPSLQRLKGINQGGFTKGFLYLPWQDRFEHSIGVYFILRKFNAPLEEQLAGLLHDVSHSAFSHTIDYILKEGSEERHDHQDNIFEEFVRKTDIPDVLKKYSIDIDYVLKEENFPLKETELPDLCADRIDYALRDGMVFDVLTREDANYFLENLSARDHKWVFNNFKSAKKFAEEFYEMNNKFWASIPAAIRNKVLVEYLQYALGKSYITMHDLYTTDKQVIDTINKHLENDETLQMLFDRMNKKVDFTNNPNDYETHMYIKSRRVDPLCEHNGEIKRVSEIDPKWGEIVKEESKPKEFFLKFEK